LVRSFARLASIQPLTFAWLAGSRSALLHSRYPPAWALDDQDAAANKAIEDALDEGND
jgi:hypothetical protein